MSDRLAARRRRRAQRRALRVPGATASSGSQRLRACASLAAPAALPLRAVRFGRVHVGAGVGRGRVFSWTITHRAVDPAFDAAVRDRRRRARRGPAARRQPRAVSNRPKLRARPARRRGARARSDTIGLLWLQTCLARRSNGAAEGSAVQALVQDGPGKAQGRGGHGRPSRTHRARRRHRRRTRRDSSRLSRPGARHPSRPRRRPRPFELVAPARVRLAASTRSRRRPALPRSVCPPGAAPREPPAASTRTTRPAAPPHNAPSPTSLQAATAAPRAEVASTVVELWELSAREAIRAHGRVVHVRGRHRPLRRLRRAVRSRRRARGQARRRRPRYGRDAIRAFLAGVGSDVVATAPPGRMRHHVSNLASTWFRRPRPPRRCYFPAMTGTASTTGAATGIASRPTATGGCSRTARAHRRQHARRLGRHPASCRLLVRLDRRAAAEHVAVAVDAVDAADRRPVLRVPQPGHRERGELARVRALPVVARDVLGGVRRVHERVVVGGPLARRRPGRSRRGSRSSRRRSGRARRVLRLRRLDHQRAGDGERHRRRVEAVVDQALGDVVDGHARVVRDRPQVDDALVRDEPVRARCRAPGSAARAAARRSWR